MNQDEFDKAFYGNSPMPVKDACVEVIRQVTSSRQSLVGITGRVANGTLEFNATTLLEMVQALNAALNASQIAIQYVYEKETGQALDGLEGNDNRDNFPSE
jgi:hypothetical protein